LDALHERAEQEHISLAGDAPDTDWNFDERRMTRAMDNLLLNGLQHAPAGGWVKVMIETRDSVCRLTVEDSGFVTRRIQGIEQKAGESRPPGGGGAHGGGNCP
jgi:signal transduction histidine kinase